MIMIIITRAKKVKKNENKGDVELTLSDCLFFVTKGCTVAYGLKKGTKSREMLSSLCQTACFL